jgi:hypothetical protein
LLESQNCDSLREQTPKTAVVFYQEADRTAPVVDWLQQLRRLDPTAYAKCAAVIERLQEFGFELRRPTADMLRNGIRELRAKKGHVNYRILYFFHGKNVAILAHAITKEDVVPRIEIERALVRKAAFEADPDTHTYRE